ncbi:preprotein translocase subunit SecY [Sandarakinorhabdus sp. AAP62]|uniref:preprotein translocase subunit SecY n=1 Tax=Sandarakinorhabdus sp. AAP62 TaxID=1248916 RepID=UPI0002E6BF7E|nr:preprotein translocase subunit SecY [Sandarakinorhabdus sp. AAP62]
MASAAEQMASNLSFANFSKATELKSRIWFTLGALVVFRLISFVPLPGIDPLALSSLFDQTRGGVLDFFNMFSGGALERMSLIALGVTPYITASIVVQLLTSLIPSFMALKKEGEAGRKTLNQYTRFGTVFLTIIQGYGIAVGLEGWGAGQGVSAVIDPGWFFRISTVISLLGGTMFLMWLGEQITSRGIGNGISLIIMAGIVAQLPSALGTLFEQGRTGALSAGFVLLVAVVALGTIAFICLMERAQRKILIQYPKRQMGNRMFQGDSSFLPLKINTSGVIPPIFASSLLLMPLTVAQFFSQQGTMPEWMTTVTTALQHGAPLYMFLYAAGIIFFSFFYTAVVFNPDETAENLKKYGGFVPGIRPGQRTSEYLDFVLTRLTVIGAAYLTLICLLPEFLISELKVPFYFGGTSLLIVVNVTMDTVAQIQSHLLAHQYEGLIKKSKLRGNRR